VLALDPSDDHPLADASGPRNLDHIAHPNGLLRLGRLAVHLHLASDAGLLGLRAGLAQAGDVEPDVESD
jgi:hypothetical protein